MTKAEMREKLYQAERDLDAIANSDSTMGTYDIEHLENARTILHDVLQQFTWKSK